MMTLKRALITGVTGQDGSYLAALLLEKGYEVHGIRRRSSSFNTGRIDHLIQDPHTEGCRFFLHYGDVTDYSSLIRTIQLVEPDEIYNLAAQSHVAVSFEQPEYTVESMPWVRCVCWRRSASLVSRKRPAFTRPLPQKCSARRRKSRSLRPLPSIHARPMGWRNCMPTGSPQAIGKRMASTRAAVSCSIMNLPYAAKPL